MKFQSIFAAALLAAAVATPAIASTNVVQGATVYEQGAFGTAGWGGGVLAPAATIADGIFLQDGTQWDQNTVWWGSATPFSSNNYLILDLGALKTFSKLVLQADNNDSYNVEYWDAANSKFVSAWNAPAVAGWGLATRDSALFPAVTSQFLRIHAAGDSFYSVSELQAIAPVPEPETYALLGLGLVAISVVRRRKM